MVSVDAIVKDHLKASAKVHKNLKGSPQKIKKFLIEAGVLNKKGTRLANRCR